MRQRQGCPSLTRQQFCCSASFSIPAFRQPSKIGICGISKSMALFLAHLCSCDSLLFNIQCPDMKHWKDMQGWDVHCCCSCLLFLLFFFSLLLLDSRLPSDEMLQVFEALRLPPLFDALSHSCHRGNFHGSTFQTFLNQDLPASHDPNASSMLSLRQFPGSQVHATFDLRRRKKKTS